MRERLAIFLAAALIVAPGAAQAKVRITIDLSSQTMDVQSNGGAYSWAISSARDGYVTPRGHFGVQSLQPMHYSKKYHNSPMPHSIFFNGGFAIHGTYDLGNLGRPASHGCVRISPANAATLFALVREEGATIQIVGEAPAGRVRAATDESFGASAPASERPERVSRRVAARRLRAQHPDTVVRVFGFAYAPR